MVVGRWENTARGQDGMAAVARRAAWSCLRSTPLGTSLSPSKLSFVCAHAAMTASGHQGEALRLKPTEF